MRSLLGTVIWIRLFSFITLSKSCHSLLTWRVSIERSVVILMGIPLCVICCFSLAAFNICSLCLIFVIAVFLNQLHPLMVVVAYLLSHVIHLTPMNCGLPGSSVHGTPQERVLEWITLSSSRGSSWPRDWTPSFLNCKHFLVLQVDSLLLSHQGSPHQSLCVCVCVHSHTCVYVHMCLVAW